MVTAAAANGREWRWITPRVKSQVISLQQGDAEALLSEFCAGGLRLVKGVGLTCSTRSSLGPAFAEIIDGTFHPEGVIYGHFLTYQ